MGRIGAHPFLGAIVLASVTVSWAPFHSSLYPYSISQPSSFKHVVLPNTANQQIDFFFPSVGSYTTNVNIVAVSGRTVRDETAYLKGINGRHIRVSGRLRIMGHRRTLMHADFDSLAGKYSVDQMRFVYKGTVWQLTASYQVQFRKMRLMMLRMLASFRVDS
jgi:hypothetical protein